MTTKYIKATVKSLEYKEPKPDPIINHIFCTTEQFNTLTEALFTTTH